jgi:alkylation response protein AidB-like acyl-CoA dehydrogenase
LIFTGNDAQKKKYFTMLSQQRNLIGCLVTEPGAGADVKAIATTARRAGKNYILNGRKTFATNGSVAGLYTVLAETGEKEFSFFIVERNLPGISIGRIEDKCGFRGSNTAEVILEDARVAQENLLGKPGQGFAIAMGDFDTGLFFLKSTG